ncbi:MAG: hypothetical protein GWO20_15040 [Candidatus Korarchaeota archaeon]|nr:hypothetical protein [Candidatus Korarchaeota archaeon]NIU83733.1 hypothetical protein [Candidatus Thorarchaeota archaeon]NIW15686.1 hypothetical protein [Candidatus Thorarchaeota archaeon]NIW52050.1 hypothetical protein [Candidatus Korarchaeota archaeon]
MSKQSVDDEKHSKMVNAFIALLEEYIYYAPHQFDLEYDTEVLYEHSGKQKLVDLVARWRKMDRLKIEEQHHLFHFLPRLTHIDETVRQIRSTIDCYKKDKNIQCENCSFFLVLLNTKENRKKLFKHQASFNRLPVALLDLEKHRAMWILMRPDKFEDFDQTEKKIEKAMESSKPFPAIP